MEKYLITHVILGTKWRHFPFAQAGFVQMLSTCLFQDNTVSISIPRLIQVYLCFFLQNLLPWCLESGLIYLT